MKARLFFPQVKKLRIERQDTMPISYEKLFALMKEKGLTTYRIRKEKIISENALTSMRAGKSVTIDTIARLCIALVCHPGDFLEYVPDDETEL